MSPGNQVVNGSKTCELEVSWKPKMLWGASPFSQCNIQLSRTLLSCRNKRESEGDSKHVKRSWSPPLTLNAIWLGRLSAKCHAHWARLLSPYYSTWQNLIPSSTIDFIWSRKWEKNKIILLFVYTFPDIIFYVWVQ